MVKSLYQKKNRRGDLTFKVHKMTFVLPGSAFSKMEELPKPNDASVELKEIAPTQVAAIMFSGSMDEKIAQDKEKELRNACEKDGIELRSGIQYVKRAQYNP
jgi:hypothetical protein